MTIEEQLRLIIREELERAFGNSAAKQVSLSIPTEAEVEAKAVITAAVDAIVGATVEAAAEPAKALTYDGDIKTITIAVAQKFGKEKAKQQLSEFGASNAKELSESDWAAYVKKCEALMKGE